MENYRYHIIYRTTNTHNGKIYIGFHSTNTLDDGYIGSGWVLKNAIAKYGRDAFTRELLFVFPTREQARSMEATIVDAAFIARKDTYNLQLGGLGVENQWGENNHMWGKTAHNAKRLRATHKDGRILTSASIREMEEKIGIDRVNVRALIKSQRYGRRGWKVELDG